MKLSEAVEENSVKIEGRISTKRINSVRFPTLPKNITDDKIVTLGRTVQRIPRISQNSAVTTPDAKRGAAGATVLPDFTAPPGPHT